MILVTGGTGLVGSHLLYHLCLENERVKAIYRSDTKREMVKEVFFYYTKNAAVLFDKIKWIQADITNIPSLENAFKDVNFVYHCAAIVSFSSKKYRAMRQVNIDGTANVVNCCIAQQIKKLCFVSSIATLGNAVDEEVITEENEWNVDDDNSGYAITKYGAEMEIWRASQEGVDVVIVNPGVILGAGFWTTSSGELIEKVASGLRFYTHKITGFVGVYDVVKAMILLMKSEVKNERFLLVSENKSIREIFKTIAQQLNKKPPSIAVSKILIAFLWRLDFVFSKITGKEQRLTKQIAKTLFQNSRYAAAKIQEKLSFQFEPIDAVIEQVCALYKKR